MQADDLCAGQVVDHRLQERPCRFDQMGPHLLEKIPSLLGRQRFDKMLLGRREHAFEADDEQIIDEVSPNVLGATSHKILLKAANTFADGSFDLSPGAY